MDIDDRHTNGRYRVGNSNRATLQEQQKKKRRGGVMSNIDDRGCEIWTVIWTVRLYTDLHGYGYR